MHSLVNADWLTLLHDDAHDPGCPSGDPVYTKQT